MSSGRWGRGAVAVLAGPDGAGKTVIGRDLVAELGGRPVQVMWQRPSVLPRKTATEGADPSRPHEVTLYGRFVSYVKVLYVFLDYQIGWLRRVRPFVKRGGIVLLERSWWDMAIDSRRYRLRGVEGLVRALGRLVPRADVILMLEAPAPVIFERRPELSAEEIARQLAAWRELLSPRLRPCFIDTTRPVAHSVGAARAAILAVCEERS